MSSEPQTVDPDESSPNQEAQSTEVPDTDVSDLVALDESTDALTRVHLDARVTACLPIGDGDQLASALMDALTDTPVVQHARVTSIEDVTPNGDDLKATVETSLRLQAPTEHVPTDASKEAVLGVLKKGLHTGTPVTDVGDVEVRVPPYAVPGDA